jgi:hypothetical protein
MVWSRSSALEAKRRDMPVKRLLHELLDTIAADHLTAAILDHDGDNAYL